MHKDRTLLVRARQLIYCALVNNLEIGDITEDDIVKEINKHDCMDVNYIYVNFNKTGNRLEIRNASKVFYSIDI